MKRLGIIFLIILLITGCGSEQSSDVSSKSLSQLSLQIKKIASQQKTYKKQFDFIYTHLGTVNKQIPKLHDGIQIQLKDLAKNNQVLLTQVHNNLDKQFDDLNKDMNQFGAEMAKKGY